MNEQASKRVLQSVAGQQASWEPWAVEEEEK
jgi:hypothetical protein